MHQDSVSTAALLSAEPSNSARPMIEELATIAEICAAEKIGKSTYFEWRSRDPDFPPVYRIGARAVRHKIKDWAAYQEIRRARGVAHAA